MSGDWLVVCLSVWWATYTLGVWPPVPPQVSARRWLARAPRVAPRVWSR